MTTIAYKDGVVAYDSRVTNCGTILANNFNKRITRNGVHFFPSGDYSRIEHLIDCYFDRTITPSPEWSIGAFIVDGCCVMRAGPGHILDHGSHGH